MGEIHGDLGSRSGEQLPETKIRDKPVSKEPVFLTEAEPADTEPYPSPWRYLGTYISGLATKLLTENPTGDTRVEQSLLAEDTSFSRMFSYFNTGQIPESETGPEGILQDTLPAEDSTSLPSSHDSESGYLDPQDLFGDVKLGDMLRTEARDIAVGLAAKIREKAPENMRFFPIMYEPGAAQVRRIREARMDDGIQELVEGLSPGKHGAYRNLADVAREFLTDPDFALKSTDLLSRDLVFSQLAQKAKGSQLSALPEEIRYDDMSRFLNVFKWDPYRKHRSPSVRLMALLQDITTYKNFDVGNAVVGDNELLSLLTSEPRKIASLGIRFDCIGLAPASAKDAETRSWIDAYAELTKGNRFGLSPMLDEQALQRRIVMRRIPENTDNPWGGSDKSATGIEVVDRIQDLLHTGKAIVYGYEIKMPMFANRARGNRLEPIRFDQDSFRKTYTQDVARSVWGFMQQTISSYTRRVHAGTAENPERVRQFLRAVGGMSVVSQDRQQFLRQASGIIADFMKPFLNRKHKMFVVGRQWPLFENVRTEDGKIRQVWRLAGKFEKRSEDADWHINYVPPPKRWSYVEPYDPKQLYRQVRRVGRHILKQISIEEAMENALPAEAGGQDLPDEMFTGSAASQEPGDEYWNSFTNQQPPEYVSEEELDQTEENIEGGPTWVRDAQTGDVERYGSFDGRPKNHS